jgi:hypothetical protein
MEITGPVVVAVAMLSVTEALAPIASVLVIALPLIETLAGGVWLGTVASPLTVIVPGPEN